MKTFVCKNKIATSEMILSNFTGYNFLKDDLLRRYVSKCIVCTIFLVRYHRPISNFFKEKHTASVYTSTYIKPRIYAYLHIWHFYVLLPKIYWKRMIGCCFSAFAPFQILNICLYLFAIHLPVGIKIQSEYQGTKNNFSLFPLFL